MLFPCRVLSRSGSPLYSSSIRHFHPSWSHQSKSDIRVRFAPSPTGQLHLGGLRTALYNYLFARSQCGTFILRIEDTDQTRLVPGAADKLTAILRWCGIEVDEGYSAGGHHGPYVQSQRTEIYAEMAAKLLENSMAYHCFCTKDRLELLRNDAIRRNEFPRYDNRCRHLSAEEAATKAREGVPSVVRFKLMHRSEPWHDIIYGPIAYDIASVEGDPVLMKVDGQATYHFANVIDDHLMKVTHVLRGLEWQVSTPKHLLLYEAFGWSPPKIGHLPLLLNSDGTKLSKRQNDVHVEQFRNEGYVPEAVLNLLTHSGSGFDIRETGGMTLAELVRHFKIDELNTNNTKVDFDKVKDFNKIHLLRKLEDGGERARLVVETRDLVLTRLGIRLNEDPLQDELLSDDYIQSILLWSKNRIHRLQDLVEKHMEFLWIIPRVSSDVVAFSKDALMGHDVAKVSLQTAVSSIKALPEFSQEKISECLRLNAKRLHVAYGAYVKTLRYAICGLKEGPPIAEMMNIIGRENTLRRLEYSLKDYNINFNS